MSKGRTKSSGTYSGTPVLALTAVFLGVLLFWVTFTDSVKPHELMLGIVASALTSVLFLHILRTEVLHFTMRPRDLLLAWQVPKAILKDCWILTVVLWKDILGKERAGSFYSACGFRMSLSDPKLVGRGALAVAYTTMSPNMIVIGIDPAQSLMIFHQVQRDAVPDYARALGAGKQSPSPDRQHAGAA